jgi:hypothetical protein
MDNNTVQIKKIHLDGFIEILVELYNKGVDYIDITGVPDGDQDRMAISFTTDYMMEGAEDNFKNVPVKGMDINELLNQKLSDKDLNDLI